MKNGRLLQIIGLAGLIGLSPSCAKAEDYFSYSLNNAPHKLAHFGLGVVGSASLYGIMRSAFDDGRQYSITLDECRWITFGFSMLVGAWVEGVEVEAGESGDYALHDIGLLNPLSILSGILLVDVIAPLEIGVSKGKVAITARF